jgi:hypothetical protein
MADFRSLYDANWIYSFDLAGRDVTATIGEVRAAKVKDSEGKEQKKPVVYFRESKDKRGLVLCKTNGKTIAAMYGNETNEWIGKRITLYPTTCDAFGKTVECIRIRPAIPKAKAPAGSFSEAPTVPAPEAPDHAEIREREPGLDG